MAIPSVLLKTPLTANTGYGNDGFALARGFHQHGLDVVLMPSEVVPPIPMSVAMLLVKAPNLNFDFLVQHIEPKSLGLVDGEHRMSGTKKIGWSMWEFTDLPADVSENLAERLKTLDALFVYDTVSAEAFRPYTEAAGIPLRVLQGGFWSSDWVRQAGDPERDWEAPFRFIMAGQLHSRKNPMAAVQAYSRLLEDGYEGQIEMHLKTNVRYLHPAMEQAYAGLRIFYEVWSHDQMRNFYQQGHCYVAPSWGEGKCLPALEAAATGIPSIHSDFGGFQQWSSSEWAWPIPGTVAEHAGGMGSFRIDADALYEAMKHAVENRAEVRRKGEMAQRMIPAQCDWSRVIQRFFDMAATI